MREGWRNNFLVTRGYRTGRRFLLTSLIVGVLAPAILANEPAGDRKRGQQIERTAPASPHVVVSACTLSGSFTVRGWDRNEVRVHTDGVEIELTRVDQTKSEPATELKVTGSNPRSNGRSSCLMFGGLELDVPRGASVKLQTTSGDISVTDVARANVLTTSGSITLTKMREHTEANVIGGDISVRDSTGSFNLHSTGGDIDARDLAPASAGDSLTTSTVSGEVTLTHIQHQNVNVNAVSGEVKYSGPLQRNGSYNFHNLSGEIWLVLPAKSSFRLYANVGESAKINSDFDLKEADNQNAVPPGRRRAPRRVSATVGNGESLVQVDLMNGALRISKQ